MDLIKSIVSPKRAVSTAGFDYQHIVDPDESDEEAVVRRAIYGTQMALLTKLAAKTEMKIIYEPWLLPLYRQRATYSMYIWSQVHTMQNELELVQLT